MWGVELSVLQTRDVRDQIAEKKLADRISDYVEQKGKLESSLKVAKEKQANLDKLKKGESLTKA